MGKPYAEMWKQTAVKGRRHKSPAHTFTDRGDEWQLDHAFAGATNDCQGGTTLKMTEHLNGSGKEAFGGVKTWPAVELTVSLPTGREDLARDLAERLKETIAQFVCDAGLLKEGPLPRHTLHEAAVAAAALPKLSKAQREGLIEVYNATDGIGWLAENTTAVLMRHGLVERIHPTARGVRLTIAGRPVAAAIVLAALKGETFGENESWRVEAWATGAPADAPTHSSAFGTDEAKARAYYDTLALPAKRIQVRRAGSRQYETVAFDPKP